MLACELLGLPLSELARKLHRRDGDVRTVLRDDSRFECSGAVRWRRWRLTRAEGPGPGAGRIGRPSGGAPGVPGRSSEVEAENALEAAA